MLDLTDNQQVEVRKIVVEGQARLRQFWGAHLPEMMELYNQSSASIRERLTPPQQKKYDEYIEKSRQKWAKRRAGLKSEGNKGK